MTEPTPSVICVQSASKYFGSFQALDRVSVNVVKGEVITLIGPSGSGKSTFLKVLSGLEKVDSGEVNVLGTSSRAPEFRQVRRKIGMVFQQLNLFPHLSVLDNVTLAPIHVLRRKPDETYDKAQVLLRKMGILDQERKFPAELSGGQQQRVAIVRSLMLDPEILLFDEPTSSLDPERVSEVLDAIQSLAHTGITLIVATHEMGFARKVSDKVAFFDHGSILTIDRPEIIFNESPYPRVREFLSKVLAYG